ncbi:hypothetical protein [Shimazuella kribbensis]|uniref:hypothetical protein n=1 Tax=Shimazuella kribbensis TaxID=139808 RepID=UPI0004904545|nr:hypothetical protein [Shimazuella kribbensis]
MNFELNGIDGVVADASGTVDGVVADASGAVDGVVADASEVSPFGDVTQALEGLNIIPNPVEGIKLPEIGGGWFG